MSSGTAAEVDARAPAGSRPIRDEARVVGTTAVAEQTWWLELESPGIARASRPGQFVMIGWGLDSPGLFMLPRPFSVGWRSPDGRIGLLLRIYGTGTRRMASLRPGETMLLLGPLGRPFDTGEERAIVCVAGGVGLAPFLFLASEERRRGRRVRLLYGERAGDWVFDPALIEELTGGAPEVWTEDGGVGRRGLVVDGLELGARDEAGRPPVLLACGPTPMLRVVAAMAEAAGVDLQVSVEENMGCGVGTCQGCVVRGADGRWIKSCVEGPVFRASELAWPS